MSTKKETWWNPVLPPIFQRTTKTIYERSTLRTENRGGFHRKHQISSWLTLNHLSRVSKNWRTPLFGQWLGVELPEAEKQFLGRHFCMICAWSSIKAGWRQLDGYKRMLVTGKSISNPARLIFGCQSVNRSLDGGKRKDYFRPHWTGWGRGMSQKEFYGGTSSSNSWRVRFVVSLSNKPPRIRANEWRTFTLTPSLDRESAIFDHPPKTRFVLLSDEAKWGGSQSDRKIQTLLNAGLHDCKPIVRGDSILKRQRGCAIGPADSLSSKARAEVRKRSHPSRISKMRLRTVVQWGDIKISHFAKTPPKTAILHTFQHAITLLPHPVQT